MWTSRGEGKSQGDGEAHVWSANICWAILSLGHMGDLEQMGLAGCPGSVTLHMFPV